MNKLVPTTFTNAKATPIYDNDYSCHMTAVELFKTIAWGPYHATGY